MLWKCDQIFSWKKLRDFQTTWSEFQKPRQTAAERGKAELCIFNFKTTCSEFQKLKQIVATNRISLPLHTANISTAKSTGFTCVPFSPVLSLSFWQSTNAGSESLYFNCTPKCFPNFTIFTCYFDIFVEKKITANFLSKIHS